MLLATKVIAAGDWNGQAVDTVVLNFDDRRRRRVTMQGTGGTSFLLDLLDTLALRTGDGIELEDGRMVEVIAAPERLAEIKPKDAVHALRLAWHLGNSHLPVQIAAGKLRFRPEPAIMAAMQALGGEIRMIEAAFDPEGGVYLAPSGHAGCCGHHDHAHHDHAHHDHAHHDHAHHDHAHHEGHGCGCDHRPAPGRAPPA